MSTLLAILLNILVAAVLYIILNRKIDAQLNPKEMLDRIRNEVEDLIRELNNTTDRSVGLIEDRVDSLKLILETADRRLAVLRREAEKHEMNAAVYSNILKRPRQVAVEPDADTAPETSTVEPKAPEDPPGNSHEERSAKQKPTVNEQVLDLHRKGISPSIIASRVGSTIGEVELIISLQGNRSSTP